MASTVKLQEINRGPKVEIQPDLRKRVTRRYDIADWQGTYKDIAGLLADVQLPWGTADEEYPECRLVQQDIVGQVENPNKSPNDPPPYLIRVFDQIDENARTQVGRTDVFYDQDGIATVVNEFIQYSDGTTVYTDVVGTSTAPAPFESCILKTIEAPNDGTLIRWKLTYIANGYLSDVSELRFGGKMVLRTISAIGIIPPTPSGYTLVGPGVLHPDGRQIYTYQFAAATGGSGTGSYIGEETEYAQSPDQGTTGVTIKTIRAVVTQGAGNPIVSPGAGYELIDFKYEDDTGVRMWTAIYAKGQGVIESTIEYRNKGLLVIYSITTINAVPTTPSPTIGGTVVLIESNRENGQRTHDGTVVYRYKWAEGNGIISNDTVGEPDGALVQTITELSASASTPTTPGSGWYLVKLEQQADSGYYVNRGVYKKPPVTKTFKKKINFTKPGNAVVSGSPPQLILTSQVTMTLLADVEVSYDETQITDVPFTVSAWAKFYQTYTPTDTGIAISSTQSLGGYLAGASGSSGTNSVYNGILCDSWEFTLGSSTPSSFSLDVKVLDTDNDPYLTATDGTVVYRRTKVSYDFS